LFYKKFISIFIVVSIAVCIHITASAASFSQSFHLDASDSLTVNEVIQKPFRNYKDNLHLGFTDGAVWIKIEIDKFDNLSRTQKLNEDHVLILSPFVLEDITVFEKIGPEWLAQSGGSLATTATRICPYGMHCFILKNEEGATKKNIYIKIKYALLYFEK